MPQTGLAALEQRLQQDLNWLTLPKKTWTLPKTINQQSLLDVAIIGGGMAGLALAASLKLQGVACENFDQAPAGFEGPWATTARMETLRSPKTLTGPAIGLPALTFRAWFEAQFGLAAWEALNKIPRLQWMDYLRWYRKVMNITIHNEHRVTHIQPHADHVALNMATPQGQKTVLARRLVLATGRDGLGGPYVPDFLQAIRRDAWAHSSAAMDYAQLHGQRVGVIGAGASAMDSAATALENGAKSVDLLIRRADLPRINKGKGAGNPGIIQGFAHLSDDWKWQIRHYLNTQATPPPHHSVLRVSKHKNAQFHLGSPIEHVAETADGIVVTTPKQTFNFDFLIAATGFRIDMAQRPEYAAFAEHIRLWADRYTPAASQQDASLARAPDLGQHFELQEKQPNNPLAGLDRIHALCYPATLSHGMIAGDIPAISDGAQRLARGLVGLLYQEDIAEHYANIQAFADPELDGSEWE